MKKTGIQRFINYLISGIGFVFFLILVFLVNSDTPTHYQLEINITSALFLLFSLPFEAYLWGLGLKKNYFITRREFNFFTFLGVCAYLLVVFFIFSSLKFQSFVLYYLCLFIYAAILISEIFFKIEEKGDTEFVEKIDEIGMNQED